MAQQGISIKIPAAGALIFPHNSQAPNGVRILPAIIYPDRNTPIGVLAADLEQIVFVNPTLFDAEASFYIQVLGGGPYVMHWRGAIFPSPDAPVPSSRTLFAGAGMTGGGDLTADRTFDVVAAADGSIAVGADTVGVGVLATDAQHGVRGGGTQHAVAVALGLAGFMSGMDKAILDALAAGSVPATRTLFAGAGMVGGGDLTADRTFDVVAAADGSIAVAANTVGVGVLATDAQHGVRGGGTQHAVATGAAAGFMSAADFTKLAGISAAAGPAFLTWGNANIAAAADTRFMSPGRSTATASLTAIYGYRAPEARSYKNLRVRHNTVAGNGNAAVYTLRINGVNTLLSASLVTGAVGDATDLVNVVAVAAGALVELVVSKALAIAGGGVDAMVALEIF